MKVTLETLATDIGYLKEELIEFKNFSKEQLGSIIQRVDKTNGRVQELERWRWFLAGGMAVISLTVLPIVIGTSVKWVSAQLVGETTVLSQFIR